MNTIIIAMVIRSISTITKNMKDSFNEPNYKMLTSILQEKRTIFQKDNENVSGIK